MKPENVEKRGGTGEKEQEEVAGRRWSRPGEQETVDAFDAGAVEKNWRLLRKIVGSVTKCCGLRLNLTITKNGWSGIAIRP